MSNRCNENVFIPKTRQQIQQQRYEYRYLSHAWNIHGVDSSWKKGISNIADIDKYNAQKGNSQRSKFGNASNTGSDNILTKNASPIRPNWKPNRYAFKSEINWMEEHAMRIDWKIQKVGKSCKLKWRGLMGPSTPISTSWCLNSGFVHSSVAIESGQHETTMNRNRKGEFKRIVVGPAATHDPSSWWRVNQNVLVKDEKSPNRACLETPSKPNYVSRRAC